VPRPFRLWLGFPPLYAARGLLRKSHMIALGRLRPPFSTSHAIRTAAPSGRGPISTPQML
jgi:hypothetical protein